jgi:nicotinamidase-related amidase
MSPTQQTFRSLIGIQPSTASTSDSTLVIIDAQNEYAEGHLRVKDVEASRVVIASLLEKYRAAKAPVVHVVHITPTGAPVFTPGTELVEIFRELKPAANESIVEKKLIGSFSETSLQEVLESAGRKKLVLVGYMVSAHARPCEWMFRITY